MTRTIALLVATTALVAGVALPANAATPEAMSAAAAQAQIDDAMAAMPGGTQTSANTVAWDDGEVVMTVASPNTVGSCATGNFCVYSGTSLSGTKISYSACSTYTVSAFTVHSIANARAVESVQAQNSSGTVLATIAANSRLNSAPSGTTKVHCVP